MIVIASSKWFPTIPIIPYDIAVINANVNHLTSLHHMHTELNIPTTTLPFL